MDEEDFINRIFHHNNIEEYEFKKDYKEWLVFILKEYKLEIIKYTKIIDRLPTEKGTYLVILNNQLEYLDYFNGIVFENHTEKITHWKKINN